MAVRDTITGKLFVSADAVIHADLVEIAERQLGLPVRERAPGEAAFAVNGRSPFGRFVAGYLTASGVFMER